MYHEKSALLKLNFPPPPSTQYKHILENTEMIESADVTEVY